MLLSKYTYILIIRSHRCVRWDVYSGVSSVTHYITSLESDYMRYIPQGYVKDRRIGKAFLYAFMIMEDMYFIIYIQSVRKRLYPF
jgi:hypothetical protein